MQTTPKNITHHQYRPDIDGLRSIAIISVVIFHAFREYFNSGFIGVDIFFVISGFLISTILFSSLENNTFSIVEFYIKRVRRIFPALITVMLATLIFAWLVLFADEFERFGKHLTAGIAFVSNIVFWRESGYFDSISETKPLLHFWSLAIEEQFYLFWPILLAFLWKKNLGILKYIILIALGSFIVNILFISSHPVATFFLPVTRVWQLIVGGVLAYIMLYHSTILNNKHHLLSALGFGTLMVGFIFINDASSFPGWWALCPTFGAAFIISAGPKAWLNKALLSNKPMIWVGKISYPMYLWHWPILSFLYIVNNGKVSSFQLLCMLLATVLLAWATYNYIEKPIRFGKFKTQAIPILLISMLLLLVTSLFVQFGKVSPRNNNDDIDRLLEARNDGTHYENVVEVDFNQEKFFHSVNPNPDTTLLIGDSRAGQYVSRVNYLLKEKANNLNTIFFAIHEGCLPIPGLRQEESTLHEVQCNHYRDTVVELLENPSIKSIVLAGCWSCYFTVDLNENNTQRESTYAAEPYRSKALVSLKTFLENAGKTKKVYLLLDHPVGWSFNPSTYLEGNRLDGFSVIAMPKRITIDNDQVALREELMNIAKQANVAVIDPFKSMCVEGSCINLDSSGKPIYRDVVHLRASYVREHSTFIDQAFLLP